MASSSGHEHVVKVLLEAGADKEAKDKVPESELCMCQLHFCIIIFNKL